MSQKRAIYLVETDTTYRLMATFIRFQEHYESPNPRFRGKVFTLEEYMDWYAEQNGNFTYFSDWNGANIPSRILTPFRAGKFDPLSNKERLLLKCFEGVQGRFYIIGVSDEGEEENTALAHEYVHGLFYSVLAYRGAVRNALKGRNTETVKKALTSLGYTEEVFDDETNAYLITGWEELGLSASARKQLAPLRKKLKHIFKEYFGISIQKADRDFILNQIHRVRI